MREKETDQLSEAETIARREAAIKRMLATPPQHHRPVKDNEANPPKKRGRPKKDRNDEQKSE
jgi:hypothetical protein